MSCLNCNKDFDSEFCPRCGEKKDVDRITFSSLIQHMLSSFIDMDRGFLYNLKNLTIRPRDTVLAYIDGKRKGVLNPISYAIITITIYLLLTSIVKEFNPAPISEELSDKIKNLNKLEQVGFNTGKRIFQDLKFFWILMTFCLSAFTWIFFKRFNFFEHLAINFFVVGHATIIGIIVKCFYHKEILLFNFLVFMYMIYLIYKIFSNKKERAFSITMSVISVFFAFLIFLGIPMVMVIYS